MANETRNARFEYLYSQGWSLREIASYYGGITMQGVHCVLVKRGVKMRRKSLGMRMEPKERVAFLMARQ